MFDFGFSEMVIVAVVALVVLGPERLPRVARQAGQWMSKLQRYVSDVKSDINRQMELDELRRLKTEVTTAAQGLEGTVRSVMSDAQSSLDELASAAGEIKPPATDWDSIYRHRRTRERYKERRTERARALGRKLPPKRR
jgi:sec-independent protein translocase protein TatB